MVSFLTIPLFQTLILDHMDNAKEKGLMQRFVSIEAMEAMKTCAQANSYTNPVGVYVKNKTKQWIAIAVCLTYLVSGKIYELIGAMIDYFSSLF